MALSLLGPEEVEQGEALTLRVRAWNVGRTPLKDVRVKIADATTIALPELVPDETVTKTMTLPPLSVAGAVQLRATVTEGLDEPAVATLQVIVRQTKPEAWRPQPGADVWRPGDELLEIALPADRDEAIAGMGYRGLYGGDARQGRIAASPQFELTALDAQGRPLTQFTKPITLRWHYAEAAQDAPPIIPPYFVWWNEAEQKWQAVPTLVDAEAGVIEAAVTHFSTYGIGEPVEEKVDDPFSGLEANLFTGSLHYRYPIPLFQRSGDFAPGLALSYESRRRDVNQNTGSYDFLVGWGWRLDGLGYINYIDSAPTYKLVLNGATYTIKSDGANWYAEEAPWIKIKRASSDQEADWHVRTPNGTRYDFKEKLTYWNCSKGRTEAKRFMLTSITAASDDGPEGDPGALTYSMNIHYGTETRTANTTCGSNKSYVYQVWPTSITYNDASPLAVTFDYATGRDDHPKEYGDDDFKGFLYFYTRNLTDITLKVNGSVARRYHLNAHVAPSGSHFYDHRLLLDGVQMYGKNNAGARPKTTFAYDETDCHIGNHCRLESIDSGQGGKVNVTYSDQSDAGDHIVYYVHTRTFTDKVTNSSIEETFVFNGWDQYAEGYDFAQVKNVADNERHSHWFYHQNRGDDEGKNGQERMTVHQRGDASWIDKLWQDYQLPPGLTDPKQRHLLDTQVYSLYDDTGANEQNIWQKIYRYKQDHQGGGQYGNLTHLYEYQYKDGWDLMRTTEKVYHPNNTSYHYIVNRVAEAKLWAGDVNGACKSHVRSYYDGQGLSAPPVAGLLTQQDAAEHTCGAGFITQTTNSYDDWDNLITVSDALSHTTTSTYDTEFHTFVTTVTNAKNQTTQVDYGNDGVDRALGLIHQITDPNGQHVIYGYDALGRLITVDRPLGGNPDEQWTYYDYGGSNAPQRIEHQVRDDVTANGDDGYLTSWTFYDGLGRLLQSQSESETSGQRIIASRHYDAHGRLDKEGLPYEATGSLGAYKGEDWQAAPPAFTAYAYDALGRTTTVTHPDGVTQMRTFYKVGQTGDGERRLLTAVLDEKNHQTIQRKDAFGRLRRVDQCEGEPTSVDWDATRYASAKYEYDVLDQLTVVTDPGGAQTSIIYDALGRKTSMDDPDMGHWEYDYDAAGNLTRQTDARGVALCFYYDKLNRLSGKKYDIGVEEDCPGLVPPDDNDPNDSFWNEMDAWYKYDQTGTFGLVDGMNYGIGRRTVMKNEHTKARWVYDAKGRVVAEKREFDPSGSGVWDTAYTLHYTYDAADRVQTITYPDGEVVTQDYTAQGLLNSVAGDRSYVDDSTYDAAARVHTRALGLGVTTSYDYFRWDVKQMGRLQRISTPGWQDLSYNYDVVGNVTTITDTVASQTQSFDYDELDRLIQATADGTDGHYSEKYEYRPNGSPARKWDPTLFGDEVGQCGVDSTDAGCYEYDQGHVHAVSDYYVDSGQANTYEYDENGNMLSRTVGGVTYALSYDAENRLKSVANQSTGEVTHYFYDGDGKRVIKEVEQDGMMEKTHYVGAIYERSFPATPVEEVGGSTPERMAVSFVENIGQTSNLAVKYQSQAFGSNFFFTRNKVVLVLPDPDDPDNAPAMVIAATFGASPLCHIESLGDATGSVNYLQGDDPADWHTGASSYASIAYQDLYPGIWLEYTGGWREVKAAYHVAPGADPGQIGWSYSGVTEVRIDPDSGDLVITPQTWDNDGEEMVIAHAPTAWQEIDGQRVDVAVAYILRPDGSIGFSLGAYAPAYELIIDPSMDYSGVFGGSEDGADYAYDVALDDAGNVYLTGETYSAQFPDGSGQYTSGGSDAFVMKQVWNQGETEPSEITTTYLGGSEDDVGKAIAVDETGNIYVAGRSESDDFPLVHDLNKNDEAFITKLTSDGTTIVYSTKYISDSSEDVTLDGEDNAYLAGRRTEKVVCLDSGYTYWYTELTVSKFAWDETSLSLFSYPTIEGKSGTSLTRASDGTLYTAVMDAPSSIGCPPPTGITEKTEDNDGDIVVYDSNGALVGTYDAVLDNGGRLLPTALMVDAVGRLFATGYCEDGDNWKACVAVYRTADMTLIDSAFLGGSGVDYGLALDVDGNGYVYITGYTDSTDFPERFPTSSGGGEGDVFIARYYFDGETLRLDYSTLLGGTDTDVGRGIAADSRGHAYVTGYTYSGDFPTTPGEPPEGNTNGDVILSRITFPSSTKYYYADGQLIAFQRHDYPRGNGLRYAFRDHLGSTSVIANDGGTKLWEDRYKAFGDFRYTWKMTADFPVQTDYRYTGQRYDADVGLYFYGSRYYDPPLARFIQPDTIVPNPGDPQSLNRYSYTRNNPVRYTDPSGFFSEDAIYQYILNSECGGAYNCADEMFEQWSSDETWWAMLLIASAGDVLYGEDSGGPGTTQFLGEGQEVLTGLVAWGGKGPAIRLSNLYQQEYNLGPGAITSHTVGWEALLFHDTGEIVTKNQLAESIQLLKLYGSQYVAPTPASVLRKGMTGAGEDWLESVIVTSGGPVFAGGKEALKEALRTMPNEQGDLVIETEHWRYLYKPDYTTATLMSTPSYKPWNTHGYYPPIITWR